MKLRLLRYKGRYLASKKRKGCVCEYETVGVPTSTTPSQAFEVVPNSTVANTAETVVRRPRVTAYGVKSPLRVKQKCGYCAGSQAALRPNEEPGVFADISDDDTVIFVNEPIDDSNDHQGSEGLNIRGRSIDGEPQEQYPSPNPSPPLEDIGENDSFGYSLQRFFSST